MACVATATAIDVRSAGNIGHGPSSILGIWACTSSTIRSDWPGGHAHRVALDLDLDAEPREGVPDRAQVLDGGVLDQDLAAGHGRQADERRHLDVVGADPVRAQPRKRLDAVDVSTFEPMPSIVAPIEHSRWHRSCTCGSQAAFRMIVVPAREHGRHDGVLGAGHRRLVQVDVGPA